MLLISTVTGWFFGEWRSPVAHLHGVQGVAGSNPVSPTRPSLSRPSASDEIAGHERLAASVPPPR